MLDASRIGHTGITWPSQPVEEKIADCAAIGFPAFETFGHVIEQYPGGAPRLPRPAPAHGVKYAASYCARTYIDPSPGGGGRRAGHALGPAEQGGGGGDDRRQSCQRREKAAYSAEEYAGLARTLNGLGARIRDELGLLTAAAPPHRYAGGEAGGDRPGGRGARPPGLHLRAGHRPDRPGGRRRRRRWCGATRTWWGTCTSRTTAGTPVTARPTARYADPTGYAGYVPVGSGVIDFATMFRDLRAGRLRRLVDGGARRHAARPAPARKKPPA